MHKTHVQAPTPAGRTTIFSRTRSLRTTLRLSAVMVLLLAGSVGIKAQNYVFYNSTYGYIINSNGNPGVSTTFTKSAIWVASGTLGSTSRTIYSYTDNTKYMRGGSNTSFTLGAGTGNAASRWRTKNNYLDYYNSNTGYVQYYNSTLYCNNAGTNYYFTPYAITISNSTPSNPTISITAASELTNGGIQLTGNITGNYTPSYSYATVRNYNNDNTQTYYWTSSTEATTTKPDITDWSDASKIWTVTTGNSFASITSTGGLLTITGNPTGNIVVTLTVSKGNYTGTQTFTLTRAQVAQNVTSSTEISNPTVSPASTALYYEQYTDFTASATATRTSSTIPAHTTLSGGNQTYYYYNGALYTSTDEFKQDAVTNPAVTYAWALAPSTYVTLNNASGATRRVTHSNQSSSDETATLTVTASADGASNKTATATITIYGNMAAPTITRTGNTISLSTTNVSADIYYTTDGSTPSASNGTRYTGPFDLTTSPTTVKAITIRDTHRSDVTTSEAFKIKLPTPVITVSNTGLATITHGSGTPANTKIYYTTDGSTPTSSSSVYSSAVQLTNPQIIRAIAILTNYDDSEVASGDYIAQGVSGGKVILDDREDHSWSYYSDGTLPEQLRSLNPADVKITYYGNGTNNVNVTTNSTTPGNNDWTSSATTVQVSNSETANTFIYYKTLERTDGNTSNNPTGRCAYTAIPNPFSKRPSFTISATKYYTGFYKWRVISVKGGSIYAASSGGNALATTSTKRTDNVMLDADQTYYFAPDSEYGMEVEFEAMWARAYTTTNTSTLSTYVTGTNAYERNFNIVTSSQTASNIQKSYPVTISSVYPDGTNGGGSVSGEFKAAADTKFENISITGATNATWNGNGKNFVIGRGVTGTVNNLYGLSSNQSTGFSFRIESGSYNNLYFMGSSTALTAGIMTATMGCDYDRANGANGKLSINTDITVAYSATLGSNNNKGAEIFNCTVKSGDFDLGESNYAGSNQFYLSNWGSNNYIYGKRKLTIEGGVFSDIAGGMDDDGTQSVTMVEMRIKGGTMNSVVYGAAQRSDAQGHRIMIITGGLFKGWIAGGANGNSNQSNSNGEMAGDTYLYVGGNAEVNSNGSTSPLNRALGGNVFGAGCGYGSNYSSGLVSGNTNVVIADNAYIERGVYGGGSYGYTTATSNIYILGGTVEGKSGGVSGTSYSSSISGGVFGGACQNQGGTVNITMTGGEVHTGIYGGSNATGTLSGSVTMNINGGQVGTSSSNANIHGGGYGSATVVSGNVELTIGTENAATGATIYGDVYGGSALGKVNGTSATTTYHTYVTLNAGTINGSLYGGALGDNSNAANVYGPVKVEVNGGSVNKTDANGANGSGAVYGCNNVNGAPQRAVEVIINGTDPAPSADTYALYAVYGGGNKANYTYATPTVTVNNCDNSIEYVYGGGNAASVPSTNVKIYGGNSIGSVFGGGNGTVSAANVTGNTVVNIYGGTIGQVFGGSNSQGTIGGTINVNVTSAGTCTMQVDEVYGGGNRAASNVGTVTIGCMNAGDTINYVYGGSNDADITGNVSLLIKGGHIKNVFGGNNTGHSISGSITVTVDWSQGTCNNNYLGNVFGGGNLATIGTAQNPKAPTVYIYDGTVSGNVYGGGKGVLVDGAQRGVQGKVIGNPTVVIGDNNNNHTAIVEGDVYGGGDAADVAGVPVVTVNDCNSSVGNVYGGGNAADVNGATVTINGGDIGDVFGGGHGEKDASNPSKYADVKGNVTLNVYGGTIDRVFAGSNSRGEITGTSSLTVNKTSTCDMKIGEVYGGGNEAAGKASTINIGCTGTLVSPLTGNDRYGYEQEGIGYVYGGANQANIGTQQNPSNIIVNINSGIVANVFGGNNTSGDIFGTITVNIEKDNSANCADEWYVGNVFGGGNLAAYTGSPAVNIKNGTVSQNVYGGGKGASAVVTGSPVVLVGDLTQGHEAYAATVSGDVYGGGDAAGVTGNPTVTIQKSNTVVGNAYGGGNAAAVTGTTYLTMANGTVGNLYGGGRAAGVSSTATVSVSGGTVNTGVYGGCNASGTVSGAIAVNLTGGTIGAANGTTNIVFGGGYGESTATEGDVTVTVNGSTINGHVYGGSALGSVNDAAGDNTTVDILAGTVNGNIYGGGLGQAGVNNVAKGQVNGAVIVNIGAVDNSGQTPVYSGSATINGSVYGCNNTNGSPKANVNVNVYKTAHTEKDSATYTQNDATYAIDQVFGGGNQADYSPTSNNSRATVHVYTCNNTIRRVFGGGNAATAYGVVTTIDGGRFDYIFGGGNGEDDPANIGAGGTNLTVNSGIINYLFGGSNEQGTINGAMRVAVNNSGCDEHIKNFFAGGNLADIGTDETNVNLNTSIACGTVFDAVYGGSNMANIYGNVTLTINGGTIGEVYAGSKGVAAGDATYPNGKAANIYGNTTLNIYAGAIGSAFGGSNINGNITGSIIVNMDWTQSDCSDKSLTNLFGASNLAKYEPTNSSGNYPQLNIKHGTVTNVYGGGNGDSNATGDQVGVPGSVRSNPVIYVGDLEAGHETSHVATITNIFGGGNAAKVNGNTTIYYRKANNSVNKIYGGGNAADVSGTSTINMSAGSVTGGLYGGCNSKGNVGVVALSLTGGTVGAANSTADVYGGGYGANTTTSGNIGVTLNGTTVYGDIYGGSALGQVNGSTSHTSTVTLSTATLHGSVFGGGKGDNASEGQGHSDVAAVSNGNTIVNINVANTNLTGIYGGANARGNVKGAIAVNINANVGASGSGNGLDIFGGGYGAATNTEGNVTVTIGNLDGTITPVIYGDIYGGSALGNVNNDANDITKVDFLNGTLHGNLYGGGLGDAQNAAKVNGQVVVNISNTTQTAQNCHIDLRGVTIYGCNNTNGSPQDNVTVNIYKTAHLEANDGYAIDQVFGGGNQADYLPENGDVNSTKKTTVHIYGCDNTIRRVFAGGNAAAATGVASIINGGRFDDVFGGGNGEVTAANIGKGGTNLQVHGGSINRLFGGSNASGTITGPMGVSIDSDGGCEDEMYIDEFFCGNNLANIGTAQNPVTINASIGCGTIFGSVYGGCNLAKIFGSVNLTIEGGVMEYVYGGSKGSDSQAADITGNVHLIINGGDIDNVFGGSNINGNIEGTITVDIEKAANPCKWDIGNVYGASNLAPYTPTTVGSYPVVNIKNGTINGSVYGGGKGAGAVVTSNPVVTIGDANANHYVVITNNVYGGGDAAAVSGSTSVTYNDSHASSSVAKLFGGGNAANVSGTTTVTLTNGKVTGGVYGGCNTTGSVGAVTVALNGGYVGAAAIGTQGQEGYVAEQRADVYGGGYGASTTTSGNIGVTLNGTTVYGDLYGGSALGQVNGSTSHTSTVTLSTATLHGSVFGGGKGDNASDGQDHSDVAAVSNGNTIVNINVANTNLTGIYGGANARGNVKGAINVNINANVGSSTSTLNIFGGGYGAATNTEGNVTVTIGDLAGDVTPVIYGDIYGGSALGNVNNDANDITKVDFLNGTLHGNIYGGGLGDKATLGNDHSDVAAKVYGQVQVNIGADGQSTCAINLSDASVYGCNNTNGSPQDNVTVNIWCTAHDDKNIATYTQNDATYAIDQVFGGGNQADYAPENGNANSAKKAKVYIHGCTNTIRRVFGGGNAAAAVGLQTIIDGGRFDYIFGGGNGETSAANIGLGGTDLQIHGGRINNLFGGSNTTGTITGPMLVDIDSEGGCGDMLIAEFFCGNNLADIESDITATIGCGTNFGDVYGGCNLADITGNVNLTIEGGTIGRVFGGSKGRLADNTDPQHPIAAKAANIDGNVTLTITGGTIGSAFGGSNINGNITGSIEVNIEKAANPTCGWSLGNVYGASNDATYTPTEPGSTLTVNVKNGTVTGNVYGGGKGATATVTANPVVIVGDLAQGHSSYEAVVTGDVYGGGDAAVVSGNTSVTIQKANTTVGNAYGGGNAAQVTGTTLLTMNDGATTNLYGGGNAAGVGGTATLTMNGGSVSTGIYGGCNSTGTIAGAIAVNIYGGTVGTGSTPAYGIFGGGKGSATRTSDAVTVTIGTATNAQTYPTIYGDIYGGSAEGQVNDALAEITKVWLKKGVINGDVYGGGFGDNSANALVNGSVQVVVDGGTVTGKVFGANNANGTPLGTVTVTINGTDTPQSGYALSEVYGGGNEAHYNPTNITPATVVVDGCNNSIGVVYGGGNAANVLGTDVTIWGGTIGQVFGGGHGDKTANPQTEANVVKRNGQGGNVAVKIYGGTIDEVFGGSNSKGSIEGTSTVTIEEHIDGNHPTPCTFAVTDVYGGGNQADGNAGTLNIGCGAIITGNIYGGAKQADVNNDIHLVITGGTLHNVFGGNNIGGTITGTIIVDINQDNSCTTWHVDTVYGGGNKAAYRAPQATPNYPEVNIMNGIVTHNVFGGGLGASATVTGNPQVNLIGGTVTENIFGGGQAAPVSGNPLVTANYGSATNIYGGGLGSTAAVTGNPSVVINQTPDKTLTVTDVFGGGDAAQVTGGTTVTLTAGTVTRAFGGGNLAAINGTTALTVQGATAANIYGGGNQAGVSGTSAVTVTSGNVTTGVYGGCNTSGNIGGNITVSLNGGTIGTTGGTTNIVFGGGYGEGTSTNGNVALTINGSTIHGNVYGGSALGSVNDAAADNTTVNVLAGTVNGNIYGGGLGETGVANVAKGQVNGEVIVNIGSGTVNQQTGFATSPSGSATINGSVYGCNNTNGSPKANVTVNIFQTAHDAKNLATYTESDATYAIDQVFGGGNQADYSPASNDNRTTVHVYTCNNTIRRVFAGGNAAAAIKVANIIDGGRFQYVYGGGNGEVDPADIGTGGTDLKVHGGNITYLFGGSNHSGTITGQMRVSVDGDGDCGQDMYIAEFFCGNNEAPINTDIVAVIGCGTHFGDVYGGCNMADITGNVTLTVEGGEMNNVYGGSKGSNSTAADITGNVILNIYGGYIHNDAFGGSNINGNITGTITVNMDWSQASSDCNSASNLHVGNVFGASNLAAYTPTNASGNYPQVNIKHGTVSGSVFGAGNGDPTDATKGIVTSNPVVVIGDAVAGHYAVVTENVYGGGNNASVTGSTSVTYNDNNASSTVAKLFGGGNAAGVSGTAAVTLTSGKVTGGIYGGCNSSGNIGSYTLVNITGGTVGADNAHANIHGGGYGQSTSVSGNVTVNIGAVDNSGNSPAYSGSATIYGDVYGGSAFGNVNTDHSGGGTYNKTAVNLYGGTIDGNVYGGGLGDANTAALVYGDVDVFQYGAILIAGYTNGLPSSGMIFGCNNENGTPKGHVRVGVYKTTETTGQEFSSAANRATHVETDHTYAMAAVYGGGNHAAYVPDDLTNGTTEVFINGCGEVSIHSVYGGGNAASTPATDVKIMGAYEIEYVFGGGNGAGANNPGANVGYYAYPASVAGPDKIDDRTEYRYGSGVANTEIFGGRIHKVFGGSNTLGNVREATVAMLDETSDCPLELDGIYGGGKSAYMEGKAEIELGCIHGLEEIYGGAEQADVGSNIVLTLTSGHYNKVYGGNNLGGKIMGSITVNIEQTGCLPIEIGELYLGGNNAPYSVYGYNSDNSIIETGARQYDDPVINLKSFKYIGTVFGGGEGPGAVLAGNPTVNVNIATGWVDGQYKGTGEQDANHIYHASPQTLDDGAIGQIFGGGNAAKVIGNTSIHIGDQATVEMESLKALKAKIKANGGTFTSGGMDFSLSQDENSIIYTIHGQSEASMEKTIIQTVNGATINGNVYGGGNHADVTGKTNINLGSE